MLERLGHNVKGQGLKWTSSRARSRGWLDCCTDTVMPGRPGLWTSSKICTPRWSAS